ncbi:MAG: phosphoglycerate dehydrogenase [Paenibacillus macerans]|uniref:D-3-phosphoglycerate dehydrogenase n=1 Tax=Paenibacillus macerans TaxID=44252 RepID=A0A090ZHE6_PAEMA|nr:phosphoglycerate dehydrogenase [Paenibacillus macerans]KFN09625.1 phosphoglycerate dehydrogenase [Paenibacillus macerans]MBS5909479.1 phosphoglycerate dehydrogenase [Paenibacillus macerans]MCY7561437.1 phosphoglycerate dehydrogenase [Paenibacillus macerans]MDU7474851.1 phosphoglycerate dehydrogenase [Paenibacillus macerans]MEC0137170.1 phosphoglycerate dehydrogenase [Paenibacillus macerans]
MFKVLVSDPISDMGIQQLMDADDIAVEKKTGLSEDELVQIIAEYDGLLVRSQTKVTEKIMAAASRLKVIGRAGVGVDNIDLEAATKRGIIVINAPDGNTITTCEHAFAMMMALARHIPQAYAKTISGQWDRKFLGVELRNKTLGVLGMGRIGSEVAKRAKAFGMEILGYDPFLTEDRAEKLGVKLATVDDIVRNADFITVHTPLTPETKHMIARPQFEVMKKGMRIINCARGGIVDEQALVEAIDQGIVAGAAFDVFEKEPPEADHPFLHHPKIIVTPHLGASTVEAQENVAIDVSEQVLHILRSEPFKNAVNMPPVAPSVMNKLQPYFELGEKIGVFLSQLNNQAVKEIHVDYAGDLAEVDTQPLTRYIIKGVLSRHFGSDVNIVNSMHLAKVRDINVVVSQASATKGFTNLISATLKTQDGAERRIAGTLLNGYGARIVQIDKFPVDVAPEGHLIFISHNDKPGIIGNVGTLLGKNDVNIASMQVGRKLVGGEAIMVLTVDKAVTKEVLDDLTKLPELNKALQIIFE